MAGWGARKVDFTVEILFTAPPQLSLADSETATITAVESLTASEVIKMDTLKIEKLFVNKVRDSSDSRH